MDVDRLVELRRTLHQCPEPGWCEFETTDHIVRALERRDHDDIFVGPDAIASEHRGAVPPAEERAQWRERAREAGVSDDRLEDLAGGNTGAVAVLDRGGKPTVALRVDIDGLPRTESSSPEHRPTAEEFRSRNEGVMHACGHDAHAAIGVGVLEAVAESGFGGRLVVCFQPAEEVVGGGRALAESGHLEDVDYLLALHVGLENPTGTVVAGIDDFLAVAHLEARFAGAPAHAGGQPDRGEHAVQALAGAIEALHGIPRHGEGLTRVNVGVVEGGTAPNIVPETARLVGEVRGETTALRKYMERRAEAAIEGSARAHGCSATVEWPTAAPSAESDAALATVVGEAAASVHGVDTVVPRDSLGGSEDATVPMRYVQQRGGLACYVGIGTDHPGGHHTSTFDVDERSIAHGVETITETVERLERRHPL